MTDPSAVVVLDEDDDDDAKDYSFRETNAKMTASPFGTKSRKLEVMQTSSEGDDFLPRRKVRKLVIVEDDDDEDDAAEDVPVEAFKSTPKQPSALDVFDFNSDEDDSRVVPANLRSPTKPNK